MLSSPGESAEWNAIHRPSGETFPAASNDGVATTGTGAPLPVPAGNARMSSDAS